MATAPSAFEAGPLTPAPHAPISETPPSTTGVKTPIWDQGLHAAMNLVRPGLFLGGFATRRDEAALHAAGVTHVLSVLPIPPNELPPCKFS